MTSTSLHVSTPTLADIKVNNSLDSPSAGAYPPTPLTPHSTNSATTSRVDLPSSSAPNNGTHPDAATDMSGTDGPAAVQGVGEPTYVPLDKPAASSDPSDMSPQDRTPRPAPHTEDDQAPPHEDGQRGAGDGKEENEAGDGIGKGIGTLGIVCAPPAVLPPSPPLTVADPREESEGPPTSTAAAQLSAFAQLAPQQPPPIQTQDLGTVPPMREEDISNWRASMGEPGTSKGEDGGDGDAVGGQEPPKVEIINEDGDGEGSFDGEYDPYDLGYSPITPDGPSATSPSSHRREAFDHPLKLDVHPPSPPPWEVIQPPGSAGTVIAQRRGDADSHRGPKSSAGRPLVPHSAYYFGPPPVDAAYGTDPIGHIGVHHPRELIRVERDYTGGELIQFSSTYPLELEGRITPTQFIETINTINEHLISAHSLLRSFVDNALAFLTLQLSPMVLKSHYEKEMEKLRLVVNEMNATLYNPAGLNILWPRKSAFMFLEIEYY